MSILFGHPTGNPNSYHAALTHFEAGWLEAFCVAWMPTPAELRLLRTVPLLRAESARLTRRCFPPLLNAPRVEGRLREWSRMARRLLGNRQAGDLIIRKANAWLMNRMAKESRRPSVTSVHSYEDCSQGPFEEAKRAGKACIYDLPIGYHLAWEETEAGLAVRFADWLPDGKFHRYPFAQPNQKRRELELADLVLVPSSFVQRTIERYADKKIALAPYGVDLEFWRPSAVPTTPRDAPLQFIYAGQCSLRKGTPLLLKAWEAAQLKDATLELVGSWHLATEKKLTLPTGVRYIGPVSAAELRARYQAVDVFVFPSYFEGLALVLLEALACGLPVIATNASGGDDLLNQGCGQIIEAGDIEALVASLRWFDSHRNEIDMMRHTSRRTAEAYTWERYRSCVHNAVKPFV